MKIVTNFKQIVGIDEVGKGSLYGPVFAGAVILENDAETILLKAGLKDSKALTHKKRESLVPLIQQEAMDWGLGQSSANEIDSIGIREATELAMLRALQKLQKPINLVLVDGILPIRLWKGKQKTLVHGESNSASISWKDRSEIFFYYLSKRKKLDQETRGRS